MADDHQITYLLEFDGYIHTLESGWWIKYEISEVAMTAERPHGFRYSLTLHAADNGRMLGYDNAHGVDDGPYKKRSSFDHVHKGRDDPGRPYRFVSLLQLFDDFHNDVRRVLTDHRVG